jgi:leucine efflux protein
VTRALALPLPGRRAAKEDQLGQSIVACETQIHLFDSNSDCYRQKLPYTEAWLLVATKIMFGITDLATFFIGTVIIVLLPGPNSMFVMTVAARDGCRAGFSGALGIFAGDSILMMLSVAGVASLIQTTPILFMTLKLFGGGYLAWLGFGLLKHAFDKQTALAEQSSTDHLHHKRSKPFRTALTISLLNPKAILFFISFFIQFVDPSYDQPLVSFFILGCLVQIVSQIYLASVISIAVYTRRRLNQGHWFGRLGKALAGSAFVSYGLKMALTS